MVTVVTHAFRIVFQINVRTLVDDSNLASITRRDWLLSFGFNKVDSLFNGRFFFGFNLFRAVRLINIIRLKGYLLGLFLKSKRVFLRSRYHERLWGVGFVGFFKGLG